MPLDPSIPLQVNNEPLQKGLANLSDSFNPINTYSKGLQLQKMALDNDESTQRNALANLQYQQTQKNLDKQNSLESAYALNDDGSLDKKTTLANIGQISPMEAFRASSEIAKTDKATAEANKENQEAQIKSASNHIDMTINSLKIAKVYGKQAGIDFFVKNGGDASSINVQSIPDDPAQLPAWADSAINDLIPYKEKLAAQALVLRDRAITNASNHNEITAGVAANRLTQIDANGNVNTRPDIGNVQAHIGQGSPATQASQNSISANNQAVSPPLAGDLTPPPANQSNPSFGKDLPVPSGLIVPAPNGQTTIQQPRSAGGATSSPLPGFVSKDESKLALKRIDDFHKEATAANYSNLNIEHAEQAIKSGVYSGKLSGLVTDALGVLDSIGAIPEDMQKKLANSQYLDKQFVQNTANAMKSQFGGRFTQSEFLAMYNKGNPSRLSTEQAMLALLHDQKTLNDMKKADAVSADSYYHEGSRRSLYGWVAPSMQPTAPQNQSSSPTPDQAREILRQRGRIK